MNIFVQRQMCFSQIYIFLTGWRNISRFSWPIDLKFGGDLHRIHITSTMDFKIWYFFLFFFFFLPPKAQGESTFQNSKCCHFFNFRNFAVCVVHAIAIFILIKVHSDFLVSNSQVDRNHVSHSNPFLKTYFIQDYAISTTFINFAKKKKNWINE